jgi:hypothetical protein
MSKNDRNWDQVRWTPFEEVILESKNPHRGSEARTFVNSIYQVEVEYRALPDPLGNVVWLSFKTRDRQPRHDWREMQQIKNEILTLIGFRGGGHVEAVELYPDEDRLVDTCNQYHLWCFPFLAFEGCEPGRFPFGYKERLVAEGSAPGGGQRLPGKSRQTDFRPELRPADVLPFETMQTLTLSDEVVGRCPICGSGFKRQPAAVGQLAGFRCLKSGHFMAYNADWITNLNLDASSEAP